MVRVFTERRVEPVRAADDQRKGASRAVPRSTDQAGEVGTVERTAAFVQRDHCSTGSEAGSYRLGFLPLAVLRTPRPTFVDFVNLEGQAKRSSGRYCAFEVAGCEFTLRSRFETPNGDERDTQQRSVSVVEERSGRQRTVRSPHLLEVVELPHFRAEDVDDDIAGIDQHPVAAGKPF